MSSESKNKEENKNTSLSIIDILQKIKKEKKVILSFVYVFLLLGIVNYLLTSKEYKAEVTLLPETPSSNASLLRQFGNIPGISALGLTPGQGDESIRPSIYPHILQSTPFLIEVTEYKVAPVNSDSTINTEDLIQLYTKTNLLGIFSKITLGLPKLLVNLFSKSNTSYSVPPDRIIENYIDIDLNKQETIDQLKSRISAEIDPATNIIKISVVMPDPRAAAEISNFATNYIIKYVRDYRTQKIKKDLDFLEERYQAIQLRLNKSLYDLAEFRDKNLNVSSAQTKTIEERLVAEYNLVNNLYNTISQNLEQTKLKLEEETPVFKILNPSQIPLRKHKPKLLLTIFVSFLLGATLSLIYLLTRDIIYGLK
jgi:uncharacterized protein involved in exopolysaccharide biosynthesis